MTWILPDHNKFSAYAQDMAGSSLDLNEQACVLAQSLMWRSNFSPSATWKRRLQKASWLQHLSTRILKPSRTEAFVEKWTASLEVIPANHSVPQESDLERKTPDTCGPTSQREFGFADLDGASLKTLKDTLPKGCVTSCQTWQEWVTERRGEYSQLLSLAHHTKGNGSSSWPTVTVGEEKYRIQGNSQASKCLSAMAARGELSGHPDQANPSTNGNHLESCENWATPNTMDMLPPRSPEGVIHQATGARAGRRRPANLREQVDPETVEIYKDINWPTARSSDAEGGPIKTEMTDEGFRSVREKSGQWFGAKLRDAIETHEKQQQEWLTPRSTEVDEPYEQYLARMQASGNPKNVGKTKPSNLSMQTGMVAKESQWVTPKACDSKMPGKSGHAQLTHQVKGKQKSSGPKLNPRWVETLMGLEIGWVSPEPCTHTTCTNRTDELRLLGNGVVPQTAERAFTTLWNELC